MINPIDIRLNEELFDLSKEYYNAFSKSYPNRYNPMGKTQDGKPLLQSIETFYRNEYQTNFSINKHFTIQSNWIFFLPTNDFGFNITINNYEELLTLYPEVTQIYRNYGEGRDILNSIYNYYGLDYSKQVVSSVLNKKLKADDELQILFRKSQLKSYFKRFFIQGGIDQLWLSIDLINHYGFDKFPHAMNKRINRIDYSIEKGIEWNGLGRNHDSYGISCSEKEQAEIDKRQLDYWIYMKSKRADIDYNDILKNPSSIHSLERGFESDFVIHSSSEKLGKIPFYILNSNSIKRNRSKEYREKLEFKRKTASEYLIINPEFNEPYYSPYEIFLEPNDFINDEKLLNEYLLSFNEPENEIREILNLPKIGEGWISETNLYYEIKNHFNDEFVIQHGKPKWLGKQHLDIYLPYRNIAIEYQGDQHYYPVEFFGGEASFEKNKIRDEKKRILCKDNNCRLIYVNPGYKIENVLDELTEFIKKFSP